MRTSKSTSILPDYMADAIPHLEARLAAGATSASVDSEEATVYAMRVGDKTHIVGVSSEGKTLEVWR